MDKPLINRVANSALKTINLESLYPASEIVTFDLKDYLWKEMILKEKDFRQSLKEHDWSEYEGKILLVNCNTDAIIPVWAYMLVTGYATPFAKYIHQGDLESFLTLHYSVQINQLDMEPYQDQRVVIKGCSNLPVPPSAYLAVTSRLQPYAQSIMYGEPCSTVPIFKRPRKLVKK